MAHHRALVSVSTAAVAAGIVLGAALPAAATPPDIVVEDGTLTVTGTDQGEQIGLRVLATDPTVLRVGVNGIERLVPIGSFARIVVAGLGGNDIIGIDYGTQVQPPTVVDAGRGDDQVFGGSGAELLLGGEDDDRIDGNRGADRIRLGSGDDVAELDPDAGADLIEAGDGVDLLFAQGTDGADRFGAGAAGDRLRFAAAEAAEVERVIANAGGGADAVRVGDLTGTGVDLFEVDLGADDRGPGDGADDVISIAGTEAADLVDIDGAPLTVIDVQGLPARYGITSPDPADRLVVDTLAGDDQVDTNGLTPGLITLEVL